MTTTTANYYALLGVGPDATLPQIKKAYRKLARQHHPDINPSDQQAADRFRQITEAYETLTDPGRRAGPRPGLHGPFTGTRLATHQPDDRAASLLIQVLEDTWQDIRAGTREIPAVVIIFASGTETRKPRWGHHAPGRWNVATTSAPKS